MVNMPHDDLLFIRLAHHLREGAWLGPYSNLTLAKGMFFPLFIAIARSARIPLKIAEQIVYLAASAATAGLVRNQARSNRLGLALFALLALNPVLWHVDLARLLRDGLYVGLSLATMALTVMIAFPTPGTPLYSLGNIFNGLSLGLLGAMFYLTREEGIWLVPALAVVIVVALVRIWRPGLVPQSGGGVPPQRSVRLKAIAYPLALAFVTFVAADSFVATLNYQHYGVFETNEVRTGSFRRAYGALNRIRQDGGPPHVLFSKDARQRAFAVSPAALELAPSFEGATAEGWRQASCSSMNISPCTEVLSGWLMWELRDAVRNAGHYRSAPEARNFYESLADQIDAACDDGRLACLPRRASLLPPFKTEFVGEALSSSKAVAIKLFTLGGRPVGSEPSIGNPQAVAAIADLVGGTYPPNDIVRSIRGWAAAIGEPPSIQIFTGDAKCQFSTSTHPAPDVLASYPDHGAVRFDLETSGCPIASGQILVVVPGHGSTLIPIGELATGTVLDTPSFRLQIESMSGVNSVNFTEPTQVRIASVIASGYVIAFPILTILGAVGLVMAIIRKELNPLPSALLAMASGSVVAVCTRIALLAYLDATSFPAVTVHYVAPASPFVITFAVLGIYLGYTSVFGMNRAKGAPYAQRRSVKVIGS